MVNYCKLMVEVKLELIKDRLIRSNKTLHYSVSQVLKLEEKMRCSDIQGFKICGCGHRQSPLKTDHGCAKLINCFL